MVCETYFTVTVLKVLQIYIYIYIYIYITGDHEHSKTDNKTDIKLSKDYENILKNNLTDSLCVFILLNRQ